MRGAPKSPISPSMIPPSMYPLLILILSVVVVSVLGFASKSVKDALILSPEKVRKRGQVYRLLTAGWLHADVSHLAFNMISFFFFAEQAMLVLGEVRFFALYISSVVVAYIPTTLRYMKQPNYTSLGASGGVAAIMLSAVLLYPKMRLQIMFLPIPIPGVLYAAGYLVYSAWHSYRESNNINHDAHLSGALYGAALTYVLEPSRVERTIRSFF